MKRITTPLACLVALVLFTGCGIPRLTTSEPAPSPRVSAWNEMDGWGENQSEEERGRGLDTEPFDPACLVIPEALVDWLGENSWEYSKTRPAGDGWMIAAGSGWYIAVVPTTGAFESKGWAWRPGDGYPIARIMPLPADWEDIDPDDEDHPAQYYKAHLPIEDGAYAAAMECLGG